MFKKELRKKGLGFFGIIIYYLLSCSIYVLDIDYIITTAGKAEKIEFKTVIFNEKNQKLQFLVDVNTFKEFLLKDICYIKFKNNKGIVFNPIPRVEINTGEILTAPFDSVSNEGGNTYIIFRNPGWATVKDGKGIKADLTKLRKIILEDVETIVGTDSDFVIFRSGDFDRGFIDTITTDEILIKSEIFGTQKEPVLKKYKLKGNKDPKDDVVQIHFTELTRFEPEKDTIYVVVTMGDGSKIMGKLKNTQQGKITVESAGFGVMEISDIHIHSIYTINSRCAFLSDLPILSSKTYSTTLKKLGIKNNELHFKVMKDCSTPECKPISLGKEQFPKGLGIHTTTVMKIKLGKQFKKFFSFYGIDENVLQDYVNFGAKASITIYGDGKVLFSRKNIGFSSKLMSFKINVSNVDILKIVVEEPRFPWHKDAFVLGRFSLALPILIK